MTLAAIHSPIANDTSRVVSVWSSLQQVLKGHFGEAVYKSWLQSLEFVSNDDGHIILSAPTRFIREWVLTNYCPEILSLWQHLDNAAKAVDVYVRRPKEVSDEEVAQQFGIEGDNVRSLPLDHHATVEPDEISSPLDPRFTFAHYMVGESNRLAYTAMQKILDSQSPVPGNNPLYVYGGVGLGKTHLLQALAASIRSRFPHRKVAYLSAEKFMFFFIKAVRQNEMIAFKEQLRSVDVLLIDDLQFISGKGSTQEEFFHTFNSLLDNQRQVVISGDRPPYELKDIDNRIRSRLSWGMVADIKPADYELRCQIIESKAKQMKTALPESVVAFLATKITGSIRELEGAMNRVVAQCAIMNHEISLDGTKEMLHDLLRSNQPVVTIESIQKAVAQFYNISVDDLISERRMRMIARPRQIAMYLSKCLTTRSLTEIARRFNRKDHTTVMHGVKTIEDLCSIDAELDQEVKKLKSIVKGS
ncbi:MAG: chromosomal replication initiator protein DnaA [Alphaproteobacteria bacterium]|nr:chromosomal replication initiator protein DnaA [Alphaproteobacteria bacterium]